MTFLAVLHTFFFFIHVCAHVNRSAWKQGELRLQLHEANLRDAPYLRLVTAMLCLRTQRIGRLWMGTDQRETKWTACTSSELLYRKMVEAICIYASLNICPVRYNVSGLPNILGEQWHTGRLRRTLWSSGLLISDFAANLSQRFNLKTDNRPLSPAAFFDAWSLASGGRCCPCHLDRTLMPDLWWSRNMNDHR